VIEPEFGVRDVSDVVTVRLAPSCAVRVVADDADLEAEAAVDGPHPLRAGGGEVVVGGNEVRALAREGVERERERGDEGLTFARLHLGYAAVMQSSAADELHVVVAEAEETLGGL